MLNKSKLIGETKTHYKVQLPSGHKMELKKDGLHEKAHAIIKKLKGYADGGMVDSEEPTLEAPAIESELDYFKRMNPGQQQVQTPEASVGEMMQPEQQPAQPSQPSMMDQSMGAYEQMKRANEMLGQAKAVEGYKTARAIEDTQRQIDALPSANDIVNKYAERDQQLLNAYNENKINPDQYWQNKSTPQKIMASIAMLISGAGAGVSGKENLAIKTIDKAIEDDINAQKASQDKNLNLYKLNQNAMKNDMEATLATKNQMYTALKYKINQAAANSYSQAAKAEALKASALIDGQMALQRQKMALLQPSKESTGGQDPNSEQAYINHMNAAQMIAPDMAKDMQNKYIPGVGVARISPSDKDREQLASTKNIVNDLTELQALATQGMTVPGTIASSVNKNKIAAVQLKMKTAYQLGVLSGTDYEMLNKLVADPGSFYSDKAIAQLESTKDSMNGLLKSTEQKLGITPFKSQQGSGTVIVTNGKETLEIPVKYLPAAQEDDYYVK